MILASKNGADEPNETSLRITKLRLEVAELARPWWKRLSSYAMLAPTALAVVAALSALFSGYFSLEAKRLESERSRLQLQVALFETKRDSLEQSLRILDSQVTSLRLSKERLESSNRRTAEALELEKDKIRHQAKWVSRLQDSLEDLRARHQAKEKTLADSIRRLAALNPSTPPDFPYLLSKTEPLPQEVLGLSKSIEDITSTMDSLVLRGPKISHSFLIPNGFV